jgi:hypothetical protein
MKFIFTSGRCCSIEQVLRLRQRVFAHGEVVQNDQVGRQVTEPRLPVSFGATSSQIRQEGIDLSENDARRCPEVLPQCCS